MKQIDIDYDLGNYAYDVDNPTQQSEKLCFMLWSIIDELKAQGTQIRQLEVSDVTDIKDILSGVYDTIQEPFDPENIPELPEATSDNTLLDAGIYNAFLQGRNKLVDYVAKATGSSAELADVIAVLQQIADLINLSISQDYTLQLSDGTKILWKSRCIA